MVADATTVDVGLTAADARRALDQAGVEVAVVLSDGLAVGEVDGQALDGQPDDTSLLDVLRPVPSTVRPSVTVASVADGGGERLVTTSDGRLLGRAVVEAAGDHDHDHEGHDHGGDDLDMESYESELAEVMQALQDRFAGREPSAEEVQAFLRERLLAEGKSAEEADRILGELGEPEG